MILGCDDDSPGNRIYRVPDGEFDPVTGDDKKVAQRFRPDNKEERRDGQRKLAFESALPKLGNLAAEYVRILELDENDADAAIGRRSL
jgi:hypothetical protein